MNHRGRKSLVELSVVKTLPEALARPAPPRCLSKAAAAEWRAIVNRMPPDWFPRESHPVLEAYCNSAVMCRRIQEQLDIFDASDLDGLAGLIALKQAENRVLSMLAQKLRLVQAAKFDRQQAHGMANSEAAAIKPWQHLA